MAAKKKQPKLMNRGINFYLLALAFILAIGIMASTRYTPQKHIVRVVDDTHSQIQKATFDEEERILATPIIERANNPLYLGQDDAKYYSFTLVLPQGWEITKNTFINGKKFQLTLKKGDYTLDILNETTEISECIYKDVDVYPTTDSYPGGEYYSDYLELNQVLAGSRLSLIDREHYNFDYDWYRYSLCEYSEYFSRWQEGNPKIGYISLYSEKSINQKILNEVLRILSSISYSTHSSI